MTDYLQGVYQTPFSRQRQRLDVATDIVQAPARAIYVDGNVDIGGRASRHERVNIGRRDEIQATMERRWLRYAEGWNVPTHDVSLSERGVDYHNRSAVDESSHGTHTCQLTSVMSSRDANETWKLHAAEEKIANQHHVFAPLGHDTLRKTGDPYRLIWIAPSD